MKKPIEAVFFSAVQQGKLDLSIWFRYCIGDITISEVLSILNKKQ